MLDAGGVVHVAQNLVAEGGLQTAAALVEELELTGGEVVERVAVAAHEVGEDRARNDGLLVLQTVDELIVSFRHLSSIEPRG